jgi:hypothetical protein
MKNYAIFLILLFSVQGIFAQTYIKNGESVYGKWKKSKSPYIIQGEATVPQGKTLKIKKGVTVKFKTGFTRDYRINGVINRSFDVGFLRVEGAINAKGSDSDPILFTRDGSSGSWGNIFVNSNVNGNSFTHCVFEYSHYIRSITPDDNATGSLTFLNSNGEVKYCTFRNNTWTALNFKQGSAPVLENLTIVGNKYGIECNTNSTPKFTNIIMWNNETAFYINGNANPSVSYSLLQDYSLSSSYDGGNNILAKDPMFMNIFQNDYSLRPGSPCIKSGKSNKNMGAE